MSKRIRNRMQKKARAKRQPLAERQIGYLPIGPANAPFENKLNEEHYERRRRCLRNDEQAA